MSLPIGAIGASIAATLGATIGALGSAIVRARSHRAEAAAELVKAATQFSERVLIRNKDLSSDYSDVHKALAELIDAGVQLAHEHPHISDKTWEAWEQAQREAIRCL